MTYHWHMMTCQWHFNEGGGTRGGPRPPTGISARYTDMRTQNTEEMLKSATGKTLKSSQFSYKIPFENPDGTLENVSAFVKTNICPYAFVALYNVGRRRWSGICNLAKNSSTVPKHKNTSNSHNAMTPEKREKVHAHLKMLQNMAAKEPRAARFVNT